jgi:hypothetical protein
MLGIAAARSTLCAFTPNEPIVNTPSAAAAGPYLAMTLNMVPPI